MCKVIIIGAGGNSKVIADIIIKSGDTLLGFLDDVKTGKVIGNYDVLGKLNRAKSFESDAKFIISIGDNSIRKKIAEQFNFKWYTAIHPSAQIGINANVGEGTTVMANAVINSDAIVGKHCIINTSSIVEHDNRISDFVHISPNATLCGNVTIGKSCHIGAGAIVRNGITITKNVIVGAGGVVVKNIDISGTYIGVPTRKMIGKI